MNYIKKIWLDLRFLDKDNYYSQFIYELIWNYIKENSQVFFNIYLDLNFSKLNFWENSKNIFPISKYWSIKEQIHFSKEVKKDKNNLVIFFNYKKPLNFKDNYIVFIPELSNFHFPSKENIIRKYFNNILFTNSCKNSKRIICFNEKTKSEINDKLNISEEKINILSPSFSKKIENNQEIENLPINIQTKYNINWEYLIYNSWVGIEKNLSRLIEVYSKIKENDKNISLIILDNKTIKDINFRKEIIEKNLTNKIFFIWNISDYEKDYFYKNALWIIISHLYSVFPFSLNDALNNDTNILCSNLNNFKNILLNKVEYFNPNNTDDIYQKIISLKKKNNNYSDIFDKNNIKQAIQDLSEIIKDL